MYVSPTASQRLLYGDSPKGRPHSATLWEQMRPPSASTRLQRAQAAAEFALILPVLALIVVGMVDFARVFYTYQAAINAAREGARYCARNADGVKTPAARVAEELDGRVSADPPVVRVEPSGAWASACPNVPNGQLVSVRVAAAFSPVTPLIDRLFQDPAAGTVGRVIGTATMAVQK